MCLEVSLSVFVGCLEGVCWVSAGNKEGVWRVQQYCLYIIEFFFGSEISLNPQFLGPNLFGHKTFFDPSIFWSTNLLGQKYLAS